jgi:hypothetical protein
MPLQVLQIFSQECARLPMLSGAGTPNGTQSARATRTYMDTDKSSGFRLWIKTVDSVAGDAAQGWESLI